MLNFPLLLPGATAKVFDFGNGLQPGRFRYATILRRYCKIRQFGGVDLVDVRFDGGQESTGHHANMVRLL